ncbi:hypothetical protein D3C87_104810 [compost metagenome]
MTKLAALFIALTVSMGAMASDQDQLNQCAIDLCGPAKNYLSRFAEGAFKDVVPQDSARFLQKEVNPLLRDIMKQSLTNTKLLVKALADISSLERTAPLSLQEKSLLFGSLLMNLKINSAVNELVTMKGSTYQLELNKFQKLFPETSRATAENITRFINAIFGADSFWGLRMHTFNYDQFVSLQGGMFWTAYGPEFVLEQIRQHAGMEPLILRGMDKQIVIRARDKMLLSQTEKEAYMIIFSRVMRIRSMTESRVLEEAARLSSQEVFEFVGLHKFMGHLGQLMSSQSAVEGLQGDTLKACGTSINQTLAAVPSDLRKKKLQELLASLKVASKKSAKKFFSGRSLEEANEIIEEISYSTPQSSKQIEAKILDKINRKKAATITDLRGIQKLSKSGENWYYFLSLLLQEPEAKDILTAGLTAECSDLVPSSLVDNAVTQLKIANLSWQSVLFPTMGAGVIAHEIGHIISHEMAPSFEGREGYGQVLTCNENLHGLMKAEEANLFAEEDWADSFAAETLNILKRDWPHAGNFACSLLDVDSKTQSYKNLSLINLSGDSHSASLFRALRTQVELERPLPKSCQKILNAYSPELTRSCLK